VYDTHLHVPLWIHHPDLQPEVVDDVVSTRDLFALFRGLADGGDLRGTLLDSTSRSTNPVALAEHFHYPYTDGILPEYTQNIAAAVVGKRKIIVRRDSDSTTWLGIRLNSLPNLARGATSSRPATVTAHCGV
jgi:hypothetical protein